MKTKYLRIECYQGEETKQRRYYDNGLCLSLPEQAVLHVSLVYMEDKFRGKTARHLEFTVWTFLDFVFLLNFFSFSDSDGKNQREHSGGWEVLHGGSCICISFLSGVLWPPCTCLRPWKSYGLVSGSSIRPKTTRGIRGIKGTRKGCKVTHCHSTWDSLCSPRQRSRGKAQAKKSDSCFGGHGVWYPSHEEREGRRRREKGKRNKEACEESTEEGKKAGMRKPVQDEELKPLLTCIYFLTQNA